MKIIQMKKKVIIDGQEETVTVKPITLFYGYDYKLEVPDAILINCGESLSLCNQFREEDIDIAYKWRAFRICFDTLFRDPNIKQPKTLMDLHCEGSGVKCGFVLIMRLLNAIVANAEAFKRGEVTFDIKHPETCLHPREQANLGDLFIRLGISGFTYNQAELNFA